VQPYLANMTYLPLVQSKYGVYVYSTTSEDAYGQMSIFKYNIFN